MSIDPMVSGSRSLVKGCYREVGKIGTKMEEDLVKTCS